MSELAYLIPVLGRPHRVKPLLASIEAATPKARVFFIASKGDRAECAAIRRERRRTPLRVDAAVCEGGYAAKINRAVELTGEPLLFLGADDLAFDPSWLEHALERMTRTDAHVVGVNDLIRRRRHGKATHFLVTREYAERVTADGKPGPLSTAYDHSWVDDEFIATAKYRGVYTYAPRARVAHHHPMNNTAPDDPTYRRGRKRFDQDREIFMERTPLWT